MGMCSWGDFYGLSLESVAFGGKWLDTVLQTCSCGGTPFEASYAIKGAQRSK